MRTSTLCWTFLLAGCAASAAAPARVWEAPLVIPTYPVGPADPYPALLTGIRPVYQPIYPYTRLDELTRRRVDQTWKAVYLENEYLKVTVLPELGGKLYSILDKTADREVLYTNHVVKYGLVALRGAWTSGGIEWNFPNGHTVTTVSPIDYALRTEPDGSASVTVGDTERIQRMQWQVTIRLRPGVKIVETEVTLNNRREIPGRYWFWATASGPATNDLRFAYPMREAYPHAFWPVFSFPTYHGVDLSFYRNIPNALSLFARQSQRDFMGLYYESEASDHGVVHVADHRLVPGKKTWTWGTDDSGSIWIDKLTDKDGQYVEFQAGRFETQMEHEFLAPRKVERFTEYWFPVERLGGPFDEANRDGALRAARAGDDLRVAVNVNALFPDATVSVAEPGQPPFASLPALLDPGAPYIARVPLPAELRTRPLSVTVSSAGKPILTWQSDTPFDGNPNFVPAAPPPDTSGQPLADAIAKDKRGLDAAARAAYEAALARDSSARLALAIIHLRTGEYDKAASVLQPLNTPEAHYYLALARRGQSRFPDAARELEAALAWHEPLVRAVRGEVLLASGDTAAALNDLQAAVRLDPSDLKARTVLALAERLAGQLDSAQARIDAVAAELPLDYLALRERQLTLAARGKDADAARAGEELWRLLGREPDSALELVFDYSAAGRRPEAVTVLKEAASRFQHPMIHYALGYFDPSAAEREFTAAAQADPAYVFPHRPEEIQILRAVRAARPLDGRAACYLGNALAGNSRIEEAIAAWRDAVRLDPSNAVAHRNLGAVLTRDRKTRDEALKEYRRAIELLPDEWRLYLELDSALRPDTAARIALFENAPASLRSRAAVQQALAAAYTDQGRFDDALALLQDTEFVAGEGEHGPHEIYRRAHLGLAAKYRAAGDYARAGEQTLLACEYPHNLGVGKPSTNTPAEQLVGAARDFERAGDRARADAAWKQAAEGEVISPVEPGVHLSLQHYYKAVALEHLGRKDAAAALYSRLAAADTDELSPHGATQYMLMGLGLKALGRAAEAGAAFQKCEQLPVCRTKGIQ